MYLQNQGIITVDMRYTMANLFFREKMIDPYIVAIESTLLKAKEVLASTAEIFQIK